jgi:hypothetical protein
MSTLQTHLTSQVKPRPDLQPSRVGIYLKETSSIAGQTVVSIGTDFWPASSVSGLRSFDVSLDMTGPKTSLVTGQTTAYAFDPTSLAFWTTHVPTLDSDTHPEVKPGTLTIVNPDVNPSPATLNAITVLDSSKNPIDYVDDYPNYLGGQGTVHPWMPVQCIEAFVTAYLTYQKQKNIGTAAAAVWVPADKPATHPHTVKVKLTTAAVGTVPYTLSTILATGETYPEWYVVLPSLAPVPAGTAGATLMTLAHYVYLSLATLQYNFSHTILEQPFTTIIKPGKHALNLSGGAAAWETMAAMIQESTIEFINSPAAGLTISKTSVRCGPVEHLEPGQLVQLFNLFQNRDINKINPNERASGLPNGGANAAMPSDTAKEDSTAALPDSGYAINSAVDATTGSTNINALTSDPANGQITMPTYAPSTAAPGAATAIATGLIAPEYSGAGAPSATTLTAGVNYRVGWRYFDTAGQHLYRCLTAGTVSGSPAVNSSVWVQISGGGINWKSPYKEFDSSVAVAAGTLIYISPQDFICTTGMYDAASLAFTSARSGIWLSVQAVPAATTATIAGASQPVYNVPQLPYPGATGAPSGSPGSVKGDLDGANVFWAFISETPQC